MIDEGPGSLSGGQGNPMMSGGPGMTSRQQQDETNQRTQYSMPGILHFLQTEWARFEMERSQWEVERAELQARIAFLQGERKGQENLKQDLVRRIKMLEFALKQERAKYHKLKYGSELNQDELKPPNFDKESADEVIETNPVAAPASSATWRQGRQLLRQYLQEIGYTDTIIDVRSARVRSLLGLQPQTDTGEGAQPALVNGDSMNNRRAIDQGKARGSGKMPASLVEGALMDSEASVLATFDFLANENVVDDDDENLSDENEEGISADDEADERIEKSRGKIKTAGIEGMAGVDDETEEVLAEFDFLVSEAGEGAGEAQSHGDGPEWAGVQSGGNLQSGNRKPVIGVNSNEEDLDAAIGVGLGELAEITVNNDADPSNYDISAPTEVFRKTWNAKYTLRSHFDGVRTLAFHPIEPVLITGSEDHTLKLWNLQKTVPAKKAASLDVEPVYTFRAHVGPVLCLAVSASGEQCYSGGLDSTIRCWNIPSSNIDPYDSFDSNVLQDTMVAHTDAVWGLSIHNTKTQLLSCSADGTVRLWSPGTKSPLLNTFTVDSEDGVPTSVDFVRCDPGQMVASYTSDNTYLFDLETNKQVLTLETKQNNDTGTNNQINCVVNHPTLPITITAHEDRHIRFFDINTGKMIHSMVAHLDAVTCLAVDPNGLYLLSGSHDCSIRLWNLDSKTCVQEITAHRKKFDESIHAVVFHPSKPYIASAGADALAKVFV
ncbi:striatin-3-like isoform X8 [Mercenaria mercenaria]|uniref:striatin-3-like isoform X8 n=1 Tax=Mercenaria mercenaria TaxID=6596 RepID=UPI00234F8B9A|nr:striatin-3-like isoform X8 [Mercenaria mercenaria]